MLWIGNNKFTTALNLTRNCTYKIRK